MGLLKNGMKKRSSCAVAINVSEDEVQFLLPHTIHSEDCVFSAYRVLDRILVEACLNQQERLAFNRTTETVLGCPVSIKASVDVFYIERFILEQ